MSISRLLSCVIFVLAGISLYGQTDTVAFRDGQVLVGEIKSLDRGVLKFETSYTDKDMALEWGEVVYVKSNSLFTIDFIEGVELYGQLITLPDSTFEIETLLGTFFKTSIPEIVYLNPLETEILDRFNAQVSFGFDLARANNLQTLTTRASLSYYATRFSANTAYNTYNSMQDGVDQIQRTDGLLQFTYMVKNNWFGIFTVNTLSNTEQRIDLRVNTQMGMGRYFIRTNSAYWGFKIGANRNVESYSNETPEAQTWEGYVGSELNLYDLGDLNLVLSITVYPGITEQGRFRSDSNIDFKYALPLDFFVKMGASVNTDNRPAEDASNIDYVFNTSFGWEF
jgi:hypothetical protein